MKVERINGSRVFLREDGELTPTLRAAFERDFADENDLIRAPLLRDALDAPHVEAIADSLVYSPDVASLSVRAGAETLFACSLVPRTEVEALLEAAPAVFESQTVEVVDDPALDRAALEAGLRAWAHRNFGGIELREVHVTLAEDEARAWAMDQWRDLLGDEAERRGWEVEPPGSPGELLRAVSMAARRTVVVVVGDDAPQTLGGTRTIPCTPFAPFPNDVVASVGDWLRGSVKKVWPSPVESQLKFQLVA